MATFKPIDVDPLKRTHGFEYVCPKCKGVIRIFFFSESRKRRFYNVDSKEEMESVKETLKTLICPYCKKIKKPGS